MLMKIDILLVCFLTSPLSLSVSVSLLPVVFVITMEAYDTALVFLHCLLK